MVSLTFLGVFHLKIIYLMSNLKSQFTYHLLPIPFFSSKLVWSIATDASCILRVRGPW